jgi:hypothetical protein
MRTSLLLAAVGVVCLPMLGSGPANAQSRTWVSGVGDDVNPCSRTAPCKTFAGAISKTAAGGIINCLDPGGFGAVTITKSITIDCTATFAGVLAAGTNGINVNAAGIVVILRGLAIEGIGTGLIGVNNTQSASLQIEKCKIFGFQTGTAQGIRHVPSAGGNLFVTDTVLSQNGLGILVDPGAGSSLVTLQRVQMVQNGEGFRAAGTGAGAVFVDVQDSVAAANGTNGFNATTPAGGAAVLIDIQRSSSNLNGGAGIQADGANAKVFIGSTMVTANGTGFSQINSGQIRSYTNNPVDNNTTQGAATPPTVPPL